MHNVAGHSGIYCIQMYIRAIRWSQCWLFLCYLILCIILTNHIRLLISHITVAGCLGLISYCLTWNLWGSVRIWQTILVFDISHSSYSTVCSANCQVILHQIFLAPCVLTMFQYTAWLTEGQQAIFTEPYWN